MKIPKQLQPKKLPSIERAVDVDDSCTFGGRTVSSYANSTIKSKSINTGARSVSSKGSVRDGDLRGK